MRVRTPGAALVALLLFPAVALAQPIVHPPEFAPSEEVLWGCSDAYLVSSVYGACLTATANEPVRHQIFVASQEDADQLLYDLHRRSVPLARTRLYVVALDSIWMRDYGPLVVERGGKKVVVDMSYFDGRPDDDVFPKLWARFKGYGWLRADLDDEGGNFMTDGRGVALCSASVYAHNPGLSRAQVDAVFARIGCPRVETFEWLKNDGTTHIDMYAKLLDASTVLVSRTVSAASANHALLERDAKKLQSLGYRVVRATMADDELSTYTNSLLVNRIALVPTYGSPRDRDALAVYEAAGYRAVGVDCRALIRFGGAIHCISMQVAR